MEKLLRFNGAVERDPAIGAWLDRQRDDLAAIAREWFRVLRSCGDEVRELMHDGCATACLGDVPFAYIGVYSAHVNLGLFHGSSLPDPGHLLLGEGKSMRHIKLKPGALPPSGALHTLIQAAWEDVKHRVEHG